MGNVFFLTNLGQENFFYDILERKNAFLGFKNKKLKKWKNWRFSKGVNTFTKIQKWQFLKVDISIVNKAFF